MTMKALLCTFLLLIGFILLNSVQFVPVAAATNVSGVLNVDTTWTQANSPYVVTAPLLVNTGVTLTIEPGVLVFFNETYMRVDGTLNAQGTLENPIQIICNETTSEHPFGTEAPIQFTDKSTDWDEQTRSGSIIENAFITQTRTADALYIALSSPRIRNCTIENSGGGAAVGINLGAPVVVNCSLSGGVGVVCVANMESTDFAQILSNVITGCHCGIALRDGKPVVERNIIANNTGHRYAGGGGIFIERCVSFTAPVIRNNTIVGNSVGINLKGHTSTTIMYNNIHDNIDYSVYLGDSADSSIMAAHNWWGTADSVAINQSMYDFKNDFNLGTVLFEPFLTEPNQEVTPDETIPEHLSLILLQLFFAVTLMITLYKQKLFRTANKTAQS